MKRTLIAALVGGIIIFAWQAASWMVLQLHEDAYKYTPNEQAIIGSLSTNLSQEGAYMIPGFDPSLSEDQKQKVMEGMGNKPWALVQYHPSRDNDNMAGAMIRGFLIAFLSVWIVAWLLKGINGFGNIFFRCIIIGFLLWMFTWYNQHNWFSTPWSVIKPELIDHLVAWGLTGIWLGWWLNKRSHR